MIRFLVILFFPMFLLAEEIDPMAIVNYPVQSQPKQFPESCAYAKGAQCLLNTDSHRKFPWKTKNGRVNLGSDSSVLKRRDGSFHFLRGEIWLEQKSFFVIHTEFGDISCESCTAYLERTEKQVTVQALAGEVYLLPNNYKGKIHIPMYMENWMRGMRIGKGHASTGIPKPVSMHKYIRKLGQFHTGDKLSFRDKVLKARRLWAEQVHKSSEEYQSIGQKRLISAIRSKERKKQIKIRKREETREYRELLRRRAFEGL